MNSFNICPTQPPPTLEIAFRKKATAPAEDDECGNANSQRVAEEAGKWLAGWLVGCRKKLCLLHIKLNDLVPRFQLPRSSLSVRPSPIIAMQELNALLVLVVCCCVALFQRHLLPGRYCWNTNVAQSAFGGVFM